MSIRINVDPSNPGQFLACCGLLELAGRHWQGASGYFSVLEGNFVIDVANGHEDDAQVLRSGLALCAIDSTMSEGQIDRLKELKQKEKSSRTKEDELEMQRLSELWERERLCFGNPFDLWIDWWCDAWGGGSTFKTWAGKQFVIDLVRGIQGGMRGEQWRSIPAREWLSQTVSDGSLPLYFDSDIGRQSASRDVGFSMDTLQLRSGIRPMIEIAAFIGLQRFRPFRNKSTETFSYFLWEKPLPPILAAIACSGCLDQFSTHRFDFGLLYRTKYLKGFLPAEAKRG